jgi:hypothetical protein
VSPFPSPCRSRSDIRLSVGRNIVAVPVGVSTNRKLAYTGLLLGKKSRLSGRILRVAEIAQADANQAKPLVRSEADTL